MARYSHVDFLGDEIRRNRREKHVAAGTGVLLGAMSKYFYPVFQLTGMAVGLRGNAVTYFSLGSIGAFEAFIAKQFVTARKNEQRAQSLYDHAREHPHTRGHTWQNFYREEYSRPVSEPVRDASWARSVLGVDADATERVIKKTARQAMIDAHPDHGGDPEIAGAQLEAITQARAILLTGRGEAVGR